MALTDTAILARDPNFQDRVTAASVKAAYQVQGEAPDGNHPERDRKRAQLALQIINSPGSDSEKIAWAVAVNPTISAAGLTAPDGDIEYVLTTVWDDLAGVTYADTST